MINNIDIRVFVIERDAYAQQAIVTYLGWDRRTRVIGQSTSVEQIPESPAHEKIHASEPDVVTLDTDLAQDVIHLESCIQRIKHLFPDTMIACLAHEVKNDYVDIAANSGVRAYFLRDDIGRAIASALCDIAGHSFILSHGFSEMAEKSSNPLIHAATIMAPIRLHPALSQRVEQALELCVMGGMPADIAADEMGVSTSTIRSYIKEGYRILESEGDEGYPIYMSPAERAFLRLSALDEGEAPVQPST